MRRTVPALGGLTVALAGLALSLLPGSAGAAPAPAAVPQAVAGIAWGPCSNPTLQAFHAQCGRVSVPLDHDRPNGAKISLAVSRVRHTVRESQYQGVMLVNPGGPGGSGLIYSILQGFVPKGAGNAYDWIGFDPRGVGDSDPKLSCLPRYFGPDRPDYVANTAALEQTWLNRSARYATACGRVGGALLDHMKTTDWAKDMDDIRVALGQRQINYYGFSYGTYLAQVYATLFPDHVRKMVLDSNVDPRKVWYQANLSQDYAFDRNIGIFFGWVADHDSTYHLGRTRRDVEQRYYGALDQLRRFPAAGLVGPDEWNDVFVSAGYAQFLWPSIASTFAGWLNNHDAAPLVAAWRSTDTPGNDNTFAVYNAVECTDVAWPQTYAKVRSDAFRVYSKAPFLTWNNVWYNAPCLTWPAKPGTPVDVTGKGVRPILLVGETLDAATPFEGSLEVRRRFANSVLIGEPGGTTHANSLAGNACVDDTIADYLATGALPARKQGDRPDKVCQPLPRPEPTSTTAAVNGVTREDLAILR